MLFQLFVDAHKAHGMLLITKEIYLFFGFFGAVGMIYKLLFTYLTILRAFVHKYGVFALKKLCKKNLSIH